MQNIDHMSKRDIAELLEKAESLHKFIDKRNPSRRVERGHLYAVPSATSSQYDKGWTEAIDYIARALFSQDGCLKD